MILKVNKIIGTYQITYHRGITQQKNLISHDDYVNIIKFNDSEINKLELLLDQKNINKKVIREQIQECKNKIFEVIGSGEWFTNGSPLYQAHLTGILSLPKHQGGDTKCKVELIK
jgi:hypothetical protein